MREIDLVPNQLIPISYHPLSVDSFDGLLWLGVENLLNMRSDWEFSLDAADILVKSYERMQRRYGGFERKLKGSRELRNGILLRIAKLDAMIDGCDRHMPLINYCRPKEYLKVGDLAYCFARPGDFESNEAFRFLPGKVTNVTEGEVTVDVVFGKEVCFTTQNYRSLELLSEDDLLLLCEDLDFAAFYFSPGSSDKDIRIALQALSASKNTAITLKNQRSESL